jgi:hypothetical protein
MTSQKLKINFPPSVPFAFFICHCFKDIISDLLKLSTSNTLGLALICVTGFPYFISLKGLEREFTLDFSVSNLESRPY